MKDKLQNIADELCRIKDRLAEITDGIEGEAYECLETALDSIDDTIEDISIAADLLDEVKIEIEITKDENR